MRYLNAKLTLLSVALILSAIASSALPKCSSDMSKWYHNCVGSRTWPNQGQYKGEFKDNLPNGQGTYNFDDGGKYVGEWKDNKFHGNGLLSLPNGQAITGVFKYGDIQWGTKLFPNHGKYKGEFKDNLPNGQGTYNFDDGGKYVGEWKDNKRNGQGTYTLPSGKIEEGIWKDDKFLYTKKNHAPAPVAKAPSQSDEIISASSGSGFAVSADGYVITNNHVIEGCQKVVVNIKGTEIPVTVVTYDPQNDLALLKGNFRPSTVFPLTNNRPELLQDVYVAGFPFGNKVSTSVKVTKGIISSLTGIGNNFSNIQIDAALQSGNSGGPILDELGNVVGVAVSKLDAKYMFDNFGSIPENTNFGIKSNVVRSIMESNGVDSPSANRSSISKSQLGKMITEGTYYISCWMTMAQVEKLRNKKVMFDDLE